MTEKEKLLDNLAKKSSMSREELEKLVEDKVNELSGLVSDEGAIYIIANDLGIRLDSETPKKDADFVKIVDITEPKTPVSFACKVLKKYDKVTFSSSNSNSEGHVQSILVGDETGIVRVVFWHEKTSLLDNIQEGDILKIINAYTRENARSERIEIHYGQYSDIEVNPKGIDIQVKEFKSQDIDFAEKKVSELEEGARNVKVKGVVTDFDIPRFYLGCPECFKKVYQDEDTHKCAEHGEVKAMKIPIINIIIDDGTGSIQVVGFRDRAESICGGMSSDEVISLTEDVDKYRNFSKKIVGSGIILGGNIGISSMSGEKQLIVNQVLGIDMKTVDEIAKDLVSEDSKKSKNENTKKSKDANSDIDFDIEEIDLDDDLM